MNEMIAGRGLGQVVWMILLTVEGLLASLAAGELQADLARPSLAQVVWHDMEVGMFIHWVPHRPAEPAVRHHERQRMNLE